VRAAIALIASSSHRRTTRTIRHPGAAITGRSARSVL